MEEQEMGAKFEQKYVTNVYDAIAPHFSHTRYKAWPFVEHFLKNQPKWSIVADAGCGNGKYLGINPDLNMIGSDISESLINICKNRGFECMVSDCTNLPYRSNSFDVVISIAVVHHFSTVERRIQSLKELLRITKPGGKVLAYVWAFEQVDKKGEQRYKEQDVFVPWHLQKQYKKLNQEELPPGLVFDRYYHMFKQGELENLFKKCEEMNSIVETAFEKDNWIVVVDKKQ
ncbi:alkbh8 [Acrasis kona]|uniref:Alkbh8 n=1 Tax=Acrasis kona TaxID=1008807 RepID=A0AAW2YJD8_9EUKA